MCYSLARNTQGPGIWRGWYAVHHIKAVKCIPYISSQPHEQIVASAIYYYEADPSINDQGLSFRRRRAETDFPNTEDYRHEVRGSALRTY